MRTPRFNCAWQATLISVLAFPISAFAGVNDYTRRDTVYPSPLGQVQTTAIVDAACIVAEEGLYVKPEIMVPLVMEPEELSRIREQIRGWAHRVFERRSVWVDVTIGTMLELPRACLTAGSVAQHADFSWYGWDVLCP